jgi:hypothetical protein
MGSRCRFEAASQLARFQARRIRALFTVSRSCHISLLYGQIEYLCARSRQSRAPRPVGWLDRARTMQRIGARAFRIGAASLVLRVSVLCACLSFCFAGAVAPPAVGQGSVRDSGKAIVFDIPAQPLAEALDAFSVATGMAGLVDQRLVAEQRSAPVKGLLTADQALRIMLAGTNLSIRYTGGAAFILRPADNAIQSGPAARTASVPTGIRQTYFSDLQDSLNRLLCRRRESQPGDYRLGLQLWIGANGMVQASHLLDSTGDRRRDAVITDLLASATLASPPTDLPQPVTVVLLPHAAEQPQNCAEPGRRAE